MGGVWSLFAEQFRRAVPADLDAAEQVGLGAGHLVEASRFELRALAEDLRIGMETHLGAAAVLNLAEILQPANRVAAGKTLAVEVAATRDLDLEVVGQRIDHGHADAVQAAGRLVDLGVELAASMQRGQDDLESGLVLVFGVRVDRDAAPVVGDRDVTVGIQRDLDEGRVPGDGFVHRVVDDLGEEMVQRLVVGAADIHAGPPADRFQALEDLDGGRVILIRFGRGRLRLGRACSLARRRVRARRLARFLEVAEEIAVVVHRHRRLSAGKPESHSNIACGFSKREPVTRAKPRIHAGLTTIANSENSKHHVTLIFIVPRHRGPIKWGNWHPHRGRGWADVNKKLLIMGGIAIVFGGMSIIAADYWLKSNVRTVVETVETQNNQPAVQLSSIVVAAESMRYGTLIDPGMLKELPWPADSLPKGAFPTIDEMLAGGERTALSAIDANEPILVSKVTDPGDRATLSRRIEDGMRAMTIRVDDISGVAGFVVPGDRVDIALTRTFKIKTEQGDDSAEDVAPLEVSPFGDRTFTGDPESFVATTTVLESVKVLSIDQIADERQSDPIVVRAVTLEVDTAGAKVLTAAQSAGSLSLQLRGAGDVENDEIKMPLHGVDQYLTSSFSPAESISTTAKVTVRRRAEVETYDVRDEGVGQ